MHFHVRSRPPGADQLAKGAQRQATKAKAEVAYLEERIHRLTLICMGMWSLLKDCTELTEEDLESRVNAIDLRDGKLDGKLKRVKVAECASCGRKMSIRHSSCMYCNAPRSGEDAFDKVL